MVYLPFKLPVLECLRGGFITAVDAGTRSAGHVGRLANGPQAVPNPFACCSIPYKTIWVMLSGIHGVTLRR